MLERMSSHELSEWMALTIVEIEEEKARRDDPEGWKEERERELVEFFREAPGVLVRAHDHEADPVPDDGETE